MGKIPGIRVTNPNGDPRKSDVYDLETGEKITNVKSISIDVSRNELEVVIRVGGAFEYEGPAYVEYERPDGSIGRVPYKGSDT